MSTFTPGPWFIWQELAMQRDGGEPGEIADELLYEDEYEIYAGDPIECTRGILRGHAGQICSIDSYEVNFDDEDEAIKSIALANARLIAAAPDLYEALKNLLEDTQHKEHADCDSGPCPVREARAALAKAEGKQ